MTVAIWLTTGVLGFGALFLTLHQFMYLQVTQQSDARPWCFVSMDTAHTLSVRNHGKSPAYDVKISDKDGIVFEVIGILPAETTVSLKESAPDLFPLLTIEYKGSRDTVAFFRKVLGQSVNFSHEMEPLAETAAPAGAC